MYDKLFFSSLKKNFTVQVILKSMDLYWKWNIYFLFRKSWGNKEKRKTHVRDFIFFEDICHIKFIDSKENGKES